LPVVEDGAADTPSSIDEDDAIVGSGSNISALDAVKQKPKEVVDPAAVVYAIPELASFGRVFRSSAPVDLTESETEYVVRCIKHVLPEHVILQFTVQNTLDDQRLDNVSVSVDCSETDLFEVIGEIPAASISYGNTENCFAVLQREVDAPLAAANFACELNFTVVAVDPATGEEEGDSYDEEYPLEDLPVSTADFMAKVSVGDFRRAWEQMGNDNEVLGKFALQFKQLDAAVFSVIDLLGMQACDGTATIKPNAGGKPHMLHLSGVFVGGKSVLARAQIGLEKSGGVILKIAVRSEDEGVSQLVADCIQ